ncbi:MAG: inositol monophosphatase family protein, partial [Pseudomonadota bacterium]
MKFGGALADLAARESLPRFRSSVSVENKIDEAIAPDTDAAGERRTFDPVTLADRNAERIMRNAIAETYPDHGIIGEEYGRSNDAAEHIWVLDPIDGTRGFVSGTPTWGVLIAVGPVAGPGLGLID